MKAYILVLVIIHLLGSGALLRELFTQRFPRPGGESKAQYVWAIALRAAFIVWGIILLRAS